MKALKYLYYKIWKSFKRIDNIAKLYYPPHEQANNIVATLLFTLPLWIVVKCRLWHSEMYWQFTLAIRMALLFWVLHLFTEKNIQAGAIGIFKNESRSQSIKGAIVVNILLLLYIFLWAYTIII